MKRNLSHFTSIYVSAPGISTTFSKTSSRSKGLWNVQFNNISDRRANHNKTSYHLLSSLLILFVLLACAALREISNLI
ncbi:MAG: hypothetical protein NUV58_04740 [Candidatus Roizmanbacteria bacterium]|nr:hypothetical protein [Candidatus Roizmanbacteria bacterium]